MRCSAIVLAGGRSQRMQGINKSLALLGDRPVVAWSLSAFECHELVTDIVLVSPHGHEADYARIAGRYQISKLVTVVGGGDERQRSVHAGLRAVRTCEVVLIHNAANPFVTVEEISTVIAAALECGAAAVGLPCPDTLRRVGRDRLSQGTIPRQDVWCMQTPQAICRELAHQAFERAMQDGFLGTDDVQLVERLDRPVRIVPASNQNTKITTREDLERAEAWLAARRGCVVH